MAKWSLMIGGGITGGVIQTSEGPSVVSSDGKFFIPEVDVPDMLRRGALVLFDVAVKAGAVAVGDYVIFQDIDGNLQIRAPDGSLIPLVRNT